MIVHSLVMKERKHIMNQFVMFSKNLKWKLVNHFWSRCETNWYLLLLKMWCLNHLLFLIYDHNQYCYVCSSLMLTLYCYLTQLTTAAMSAAHDADIVLLQDKELNETWEQSLKTDFSWKKKVMSWHDYKLKLSQSLTFLNNI